MRLLLDTHVFLWAVTADRRLRPSTRQLISRAEAVFVSTASIRELAVSARHAAAVANLPLHHSDPFDRLLLAQAFMEPLRFMTADSGLIAYGGAMELL